MPTTTNANQSPGATPGKAGAATAKFRGTPKVLSRMGRCVFPAIIMTWAFASCHNPVAPPPGVQAPRVFPSLHVSIAAGDIDRHNWTRNATVSLVCPQGGFEFGFENASAQVRGRGNSTWFSMGEKRPFRIRFDVPRSMFGGDFAARDWTVIANAMDYTLMRNYSAYFLGRMLDGQCFAPSGHFVHVYLAGEYRGVYMISDQVQVHEGRVELAGSHVPMLSEYFLEWCRRAEGSGDTYFVIPALAGTTSRVPFVIDYPGGGMLNSGHVQFAQDFVTNVDLAIWRGNYGEVSRLIDVDSFVDYYLVQELFRNHDVGHSSLRFQIRRTETGSGLFAGPLWDFDFSSGSGQQTRPNVFDYRPNGEWAARWNPWFRHLMGTEWFVRRVAERWDEIRDDEVARMIERIRELEEIYRACFERNFARWPDKLGNDVFTIPGFQTSPSVMAIPDFAGNVTYLVSWLEQRISWMNWFFARNAAAARHSAPSYEAASTFVHADETTPGVPYGW